MLRRRWLPPARNPSAVSARPRSRVSWRADCPVLVAFLVFLLILPALGETDPSDYAVLDEFRKGLENGELLKWPAGDRDPCGAPPWPHVFCAAGRVQQIQLHNMGLRGPLPQTFNRLVRLYNLGLQGNRFSGAIPTFRGLSELQFVFLDGNAFTAIPSDFFDGLTALREISLDGNLFNASTGWALPDVLQDSSMLVNFSCSGCGIVGPIPDFLGNMHSLSSLRLANNKLTGGIPDSFRGLGLKILRLNNQDGGGLSGSIDILTTMPLLTEVYLRGNALTGTIPDNISLCGSLRNLSLENNQLTGILPASLGKLQDLKTLGLSNNKFVGPIPKLQANMASDGNSFCQKDPGVPCSPEVDALLDFLGGLNYPLDLAAAWSGNNPCDSSWLGISCSSNRVSVINLPNHKLNGFISPSIAKLDSLVIIRLDANNISGVIPTELTNLKLLRMLNLTLNNLSPPVPKFDSSVTLLVDQNPLFNAPPSPPGTPAPGGPSTTPSSPRHDASMLRGSRTVKVVVSAITALLVVALIAIICIYLYKRNRKKSSSIASTIPPPSNMLDPDRPFKVEVSQQPVRTLGKSDVGSSVSKSSHDSGNFLVSMQILRSVTRDFSSENELGRGGFGVVYKGELDDGTMIAVKRMVATVISNKALDEFQSEIEVLSSVRHRNLVSLMGFSVEGNERLLVYEYMSQGALSRHLFQWRTQRLLPLCWMTRLNIALDVARGMEYLHSFAHHSFIHRDLKSSNILLDDTFRAKVADFGLVKLSPDGQRSMATRLAGTFGYLAPEYAVTGRISTKVDVFSFGVVLMELVTGMRALDESRPEDTRHLASWFHRIILNKDMLMASIDDSLKVTEQTFESYFTVAKLAGHCTAREPHQRPDMGYAVSVLAPLVGNWKPMNDGDLGKYHGIDMELPLADVVKDWQERDALGLTQSSIGDSNSSIPVGPNAVLNSLKEGR